MIEDISQRNTSEIESEMDSDLALDKVGRLIAGVARIGEMRLDVGECRSKTLTLLVELIDATSAAWAWGVANDSAESIAAIATVEVGVTASQSAAIINMGLDPKMFEEFRRPITEKWKVAARGTDLRTDLYDDQQWKTTRMYANLIEGGYDEWLHSFQYESSETWSGVFFLRQAGLAPFQPADRQLIDLAMRSIPWFGTTLEVVCPAQSSVALTTRQRMVLIMQFNGLSRKQIASRLEISVDTVGDHMKQIYEHFHVNSAGELAAIFLRGR
ncbi:Bacterial regulatory protein, luxR family [Rubripirellula obstinata]|uniref:Bacterial regulatory protein, luxR family n=1 Tax=Rubripirellula obstinata TaxID=406547 RepID=A0A5B1CM90_9BACT|nr:LuxR C-terminal-related transcriptional regulator [Rubripirellula obstinata]KAA1260454.1 Bacterial regulatory protein, luxR family [Rubripirellula obstinata]